MIVAAEVNYLKTEEMSRFYNKNFELLEPHEGKLSRTVLRGERGSNAPDLPDKSSRSVFQSHKKPDSKPLNAVV